MPTDPVFDFVAKNFAALSTSAVALNKASAELASAVAHLNEKMRRLNLGLDAWVLVRDRKAPEPFYDVYELGWVKLEGRWALAIRRRSGDENEQDEEKIEGPWLFNDAKRSLRIESVSKIPDLLEALVKKSAKLTADLTASTNQVVTFGSAINAASTFSAPPITPPSVREKTHNGGTK